MCVSWDRCFSTDCFNREVIEITSICADESRHALIMHILHEILQSDGGLANFANILLENHKNWSAHLLGSFQMRFLFSILFLSPKDAPKVSHISMTWFAIRQSNWSQEIWLQLSSQKAFSKQMGRFDKAIDVPFSSIENFGKVLWEGSYLLPPADWPAGTPTKKAWTVDLPDIAEGLPIVFLGLRAMGRKFLPNMSVLQPGDAQFSQVLP